MGYGQNYYTLRSIFFDGVPPPEVHMHLRIFDVKRDIPVGNLETSKTNGSVEVDIPAEEKERFDLWLRKLWREKDESMDRFYETGFFDTSSASKGLKVEIPLKLGRKREILDAFCFFLPAGVAYLWGRVRG